MIEDVKWNSFMTSPENTKPRFKLDCIHYTAIILSVLSICMILARYYVAPCLFLVSFIIFYWQERHLVCQARFLWEKVRLTICRFVQGHSRKCGRENAKNPKKTHEDANVHDNLGQCDPLLLVHERIWLRILSYLDNSEDITSCYYACQPFRIWLGTHINAQAFLVLDNYMKKHTFFGYLDETDLLNCRLVCTSWKLAVDCFLQGNPAFMQFVRQHYPTTVIDSRYSDHVEGLIERLVRNYERGNNNPFPSRHLQLKIHADVTEDDRRIFQEAVSILLKYFGKHVWYFTILASVQPQEFETYQLVFGFLKQTPNVRMVNLCFTDMPATAGNLEIANFSGFIQSNQIPKLHRMTSLRLEECPDEIICTMLERNKQVERLEVKCKQSIGHHDWIIKLQGTYPEMPGLSKLSLVNIPIAQLQELQNVKWPLANLNLTVNTETESVQQIATDLVAMFTTFQQFSTSLKRLSFNIKQDFIENQRLVLPYLQELEIHFEGKFSIDFMQSTKSLKILKVILNNKYDLDIVNLMVDIKIVNKQYKTNIWRLFPKLNEVMVSFKKRSGKSHAEETCIYYRHGDSIFRFPICN